jgi:RecG-like helicase
MSRPPALFPLFAELQSLEGVGPKTAALLGHLEVHKPRDLLFTLPHSVVDRRRRASLAPPRWRWRWAATCRRGPGAGLGG